MRKEATMVFVRAACVRLPPALVFLLLLNLFFDGFFPAEAHQIFGTEQTITIDGTSTLRDWSCSVAPRLYVHDLGNILEALPQNFSGAIHATMHVAVSVRDIVCENDTMTKHLRNALRWEKHPEIRFETHGALVNEQFVDIPGELTIAGVTRNITLRAALTDVANGEKNLSGSVTIDMRDYQVKPPVISLLFLKAKVMPEITLSFSVSTAISWRRSINPQPTERSEQ